jgi:hypothetical protein
MIAGVVRRRPFTTEVHMAPHVDPIRLHASLRPGRWRDLAKECADLRAEMDELDHQLDALSRRRREAARRLRIARRELFPNLTRRGRCPLPDGTPALPPVPPGAVGLWGRQLRARCREILDVGGHVLELRDLHALLHRRGFYVDSSHPVKALADAMRYEVGVGRLRRVRRGVYAPTGMPAAA